MLETREILSAYDEALGAGEPVVLATVVRAFGSTYRRPGARMLITEHGWRGGSVSGGCLEADVVRTAFQHTEEGPTLVRYDSRDPGDIVWGFGLGCDGAVDVLFERLEPEARTNPLEFLRARVELRKPGAMAIGLAGETLGKRAFVEGDDAWGDERLLLIARDALAGRVSAASDRELAEFVPPPVHLAIFGAGHDAIPLAAMGSSLGWRVTVADVREEYVRPERFPAADALVHGRPERAVDQAWIDERTAAVVMTHAYLTDRELLPRLLASPAPYVGVLGPPQRRERLLNDLETPLPEHDLARIYGPVGIALGASEPAGIALEISAQIQSVFATPRPRVLSAVSPDMRESPACAVTA